MLVFMISSKDACSVCTFTVLPINYALVVIFPYANHFMLSRLLNDTAIEQYL